MTASTLRVRWRRWIKTLVVEVRDLRVTNYFQHEVQDVIRANPRVQQPADFYLWMARNYAYAALLRIRRLMDRNPNTRSLYGLLLDLEQHAQALTRTSHLSFYPADARDDGEAFFDRIAGNGRTTMDPRRIRRDRRHLERAHLTVRLLVNRQIAHVDGKRRRIRVPTYQDIERISLEFEGTLKKYETLLTGVATLQYLPVYQFDWRSVFREPWIAATRDDEAGDA